MNKKKAQFGEIRREIASKHAQVIQRQHPEWTLQQVNDAAYKLADRQIKRDEVRVS